MSELASHTTNKEYMTLCHKALKALGGSGSGQAILDKVAALGNFSADDLKILHDPDRSATQTEVDYRLQWARTNLKGGGYIKNVRHGYWALTEKGGAAETVDPTKYRASAAIMPDDEDANEVDEKNPLEYELECELQTDPQLDEALLGEGLLVQSREYAVPVYGRIDKACQETTTGEFTSVELKIGEADDRDAAQACRYLRWQETVKGWNKAGRVLIIAPGFSPKFWSVARRFPEIQAFVYLKGDGNNKLTLTRVLPSTELVDSER
jgi:hypothetical protein